MMRSSIHQWSLAGLVAVLGAGCGQQEQQISEPKITGGEVVPFDQDDARSRSTVAITTTYVGNDGADHALAQGTSFCTGTLVSANVVVTAAHCLQQFDSNTLQKLDNFHYETDEFVVYMGPQVAEDGHWVRAKEVIPHPDWDVEATLSPNSALAPHDIGVIVLEHPVAPRYRPAPLADPDLDLANKTIHLAGYGISLARFAPDTGLLRQVDVIFSEHESQKQRFSVSGFATGACAGDSGGPAFIQVGGEMQLIGATSTGVELFGVCLGLLNYYTDARTYHDWISDIQDRVAP